MGLAMINNSSDSAQKSTSDGNQRRATDHLIALSTLCPNRPRVVVSIKRCLVPHGGMVLVYIRWEFLVGSDLHSLRTMSSSGPVFQNSVYVGINVQDILYGELGSQSWSSMRSYHFVCSQGSSWCFISRRCTSCCPIKDVVRKPTCFMRSSAL